MKPVLLCLLVVQLATGNQTYNMFVHRIVLNQKDLRTQPTRRIYGGEDAAENQFPFLVFMIAQIHGKQTSCCSGSIIHKDWILIAAHCLDYKDVRPENIILAGGKAVITGYLLERLQSSFYKIIPESFYGVQERRARSVFLHPKRTDSHFHDIALIRLAKRFNLKRIREIKMANVELKPPTKCTVLGWGINSLNSTDGKLRYVNDQSVSTTKVGCLYKKSGPFICIAPSVGGICQGDSGSPLICENEVYGVASHIISTSLPATCGFSSEEYYSAVHPELEWLYHTMETNSKTSNIFNSNSSLIVIVMSLYLFFSWLKIKFM